MLMFTATIVITTIINIIRIDLFFNLLLYDDTYIISLEASVVITDCSLELKFNVTM